MKELIDVHIEEIFDRRNIEPVLKKSLKRLLKRQISLLEMANGTVTIIFDLKMNLKVN